MQAAFHGSHDDVFRHKVEGSHLLLHGEGGQQAAVYCVNMNGVLALKE